MIFCGFFEGFVCFFFICFVLISFPKEVFALQMTLFNALQIAALKMTPAREVGALFLLANLEGVT